VSQQGNLIWPLLYLKQDSSYTIGYTAKIGTLTPMNIMFFHLALWGQCCALLRLNGEVIAAAGSLFLDLLLSQM
jgi:hypothetical protein